MAIASRPFVSVCCNINKLDRIHSYLLEVVGLVALVVYFDLATGGGFTGISVTRNSATFQCQRIAKSVPQSERAEWLNRSIGGKIDSGTNTSALRSASVGADA